MIAFLDACALIYLIEGQAQFSANVRSTLSHIEQSHPGMAIAISRLSWLECQVLPMKNNDANVVAQYRALFARPDILWIELDSKAVELATAIRVRHNLRTPDALQAACCLQLGPEHVFVTGDTAFKRVSGLNVALL